ncbi:MAG: gamma-glutamylcyclotransferase [Myxococcales bacterium]|nr:gamma-glutamylcyclotransferase [Myxococcales bacterium]
MSTDERRTVPATVVDRLFVYGTLRTGQTARAIVAAHLVGGVSATTRGSLYAFPGDYPGVVPDDGGVIVGELLQLRDLASALPLLDAFEGDEFMRMLTEVTTADGGTWAWIYVLVSPELARHGRRLEHGDWARYLARAASDQDPK